MELAGIAVWREVLSWRLWRRSRPAVRESLRRGPLARAPGVPPREPPRRLKQQLVVLEKGATFSVLLEKHPEFHQHPGGGTTAEVDENDAVDACSGVGRSPT